MASAQMAAAAMVITKEEMSSWPLNSETEVQKKGVENFISVFYKKIACIEYCVDDQEAELRLKLEVPGVKTLPEDKIDIDIQPWLVEVKIQCGERYYFLKISRLFAEIDPRRSFYVRTEKDYLLFKLHKVNARKWDHLSYHRPQIIENFKKSFTQYVDSSPILTNRDNNLLFDMWLLERVVIGGLEFRNYLTKVPIELPSYVITIPQCLEFLKSYIKPSSTDAEFECIAIAFFLAEKTKYEDVHPKGLADYDECPDFPKSLKKEAECIRMTSIEYCTAAIILDPFNWIPYFYSGKCLLEIGHSKAALDKFLKAKILDPTSPNIDDEFHKTYRLEHYKKMYLKAVCSKDESEREENISRIRSLMDPEKISNTLVTYICDEGFIAEAKAEAIRVCCYEESPEYAKYCLLAVCFYYEDDEEAFEENLRRVKKEKPQIPNVQLLDYISGIFFKRRIGDQMFADGRYKEAIGWYCKVAENYANIPLIRSKAYYMIGCSYSKLNDLDESISFFSNAIDKKSDYHEAFATRGKQFMEQKHFQKALEDFEKANEIAPCDHYKKSIEKARLKQPLEKEPLAQILVCDSSAENKVETKLQTLALTLKEKGNDHFAEKRYTEAIESYSGAVELDPSNPVYSSNLAVCHIMLKDFKEGLRYSEKAVSVDPSFVKGLYKMGQCHINLGNPNEAITALEKAKSLNRSDKSICNEIVKANALKEYLKRVTSAYNAKDYCSANEYLSAAIKKAPASLQLRIARIECLICLKKFKEAKLEADKVASLYSTDFKIYYYLGVCHFNTRDHKIALVYIETALRLNNDERILRMLQLLWEYDLAIRILTGNRRDRSFQTIKSKVNEECLLFIEQFSNKDLSIYKRDIDDENCQAAITPSQSDNLDLYLQKAVIHMKIKNYKEALIVLRKIVEQDRTCLKTFILLGECNTILGYVEEAISAFDKARKLDSLDKVVLAGFEKVLKYKDCLMKAELANQEGDYSTAYEQYNSAFGIAHMNSSLLLNIAECLINLHKFLDLSNFVKSLNVLKGSSEYWCIKGLDAYYAYYGEYHSQTLLEMAIGIDPSNEKYRKYLNTVKSAFDTINKGFAAFKTYNFDEAILNFNEIFKIDPNNYLMNFETNYYSGVIKVKQNDDVTEALEHFSKAIELMEKYMGNEIKSEKHLKVETYMGDEEVIIKRFAKVVDLREKYICALEKRAWCYKKLESFENAVSDYETLHKLTSSPHSGLYKKIAYDIRRIKLNEFEDGYQMAVDCQENDRVLTRNKGEIVKGSSNMNSGTNQALANNRGEMGKGSANMNKSTNQKSANKEEMGRGPDMSKSINQTSTINRGEMGRGSSIMNRGNNLASGNNKGEVGKGLANMREGTNQASANNRGEMSRGPAYINKGTNQESANKEEMGRGPDMSKSIIQTSTINRGKIGRGSAIMNRGNNRASGNNKGEMGKGLSNMREGTNQASANNRGEMGRGPANTREGTNQASANNRGEMGRGPANTNSCTNQAWSNNRGKMVRGPTNMNYDNNQLWTNMNYGTNRSSANNRGEMGRGPAHLNRGNNRASGNNREEMGMGLANNRKWNTGSVNHMRGNNQASTHNRLETERSSAYNMRGNNFVSDNRGNYFSLANNTSWDNTASPNHRRGNNSVWPNHRRGYNKASSNNDWGSDVFGWNKR